MEHTRYFKIVMRDADAAYAEWETLCDSLDEHFPFLSGLGRKREGRYIWTKLHSESAELLALTVEQLTKAFESSNLEAVEDASQTEFWNSPSNPTP